MLLTILAASTETAAASGGLVEDLQKNFGLNWAYLIAQCINFVIVAYVLKKFAFGPIGDMLSQRRERIAEGEAKLKQIEQDLQDSEKRTAEAIEKANNKAKEMITEAKTSAANITEEKTQEAIASAQNILAKAEETAKAERSQMVKELKSDFGKLVATATATVSGKVLTDADHKSINEDALAVIEK